MVEGQRGGLAIRRSRVRIPLWSIATLAGLAKCTFHYKKPSTFFSTFMTLSEGVKIY